MADKDKEEPEDDDLKDLILRQLATLEQSEGSDDESYKVRLSCILEDDESESSGGAQKEYAKNVEKGSERTKESEKGPPGTLIGVEIGESMYESEQSDDFVCENVQITDLDDVTLCEGPKTEESEKTEETESEGMGDEFEKSDGFAIKKLKSSDNVHKRPFIVKRRELSSDSSDLDISVTNSAEGPPNDVKIVEITEDDENTMNVAPDNVYVESETSAEEDLEEKVKTDTKGDLRIGDFEVLDTEILSSLFAKVSREYLEKTKGYVKWVENEKVDHLFGESSEDKPKPKKGQPGDHLCIQDVHIRGTSPREYNPPVPPETYLWEELKRLRERGGYPWTYLDKPPFDEATWKKYMENVYEPINPPPLSTDSRPQSSKTEDTERAPTTPVKPVTLIPPTTLVTPATPSTPGTPATPATPTTPVTGSSIPETENGFVRIPSEHEMIKKGKDSVDESKNSEDMEVERISSAQELQNGLEDRFLTVTSTTTSPTTASQSRTDVTSGFEDLPIKEGPLGKTRREQMRARAQDIQQRLRNHAGRIRSKFSNIQRPALGRKDRSKKEKPVEKSRFKLPEMHPPKINLPDRSKFKFPEGAKLHLPETSKFHLPDRSKFRLPEKSKFHLPERPKLNLAERARASLPDRSKFHFPERPKLHLPDRSKFHFPERAKFHLPDKSKFHLPDRSKFHLPDKSKFHLPNRPKLELPVFRRSDKTTESSGKGRFDFKPKLFTKQPKDYTTSSPKQTRGRTPPPKMMQQQTSSPRRGSEKWMEKLDDLKYADDEADEAGIRETDSRKSEKSGSMFEYPERETGYVEDFGKVSHDARTLSTKSSASRLSEKESPERKKGVLEEINPDEFFLRQKGISQDDIDMGKYLSREIREAFRSPDINALAKMDYMDVDDENIDPRKYPEPRRPNRTISVKKKSILKKTSTSDPSLPDDGYKTYPPRRPGRKSRSQSKSLLNEDAAVADTVEVRRYDEPDVNLSRYDNVEYDEDNISEYYKTPGPAMEYEHYKVPRSHPVSPSPPVKRKSSAEDDISNKIRIHEGWKESQPLEMTEPPKPLQRKKSKRKRKTPGPGDQESVGEEQIPQEVIQVREEVVLEPKKLESPVAPKRTRSKSSGSRSLKSLATEDDLNRSFRSEPDRDRLAQIEDSICEREEPIQESPMMKGSSDVIQPAPHVYEVTDLDDVGFGYATVGKPTIPKPERQKKPERPPPPRRKKEVSVPTYNTYPRRAPTRPLRNYSTLGPSKPPRRRKMAPVEKSLAEIQFRTYSEIHTERLGTEPVDFIEVSESAKDLQTEKVIEKMKGRPLPPPPRPPRQKSKGPEEEFEQTEEEKLSLSILKDDEFPIEKTVTAVVHKPPPKPSQPVEEKEFVEEICAATQTDPLPEDFSFETDDNEMIQEFSHEQLKIQQAFLEEMKREEEEMRQKGRTNENNLVDAELKAEVIRQIEDIIAEEKRLLHEKQNEERIRKEEAPRPSEKEQEPNKQEKSYLDKDADMGYASLDRKNHRQELPNTSREVQPTIPTKLEKLQVKELEVDTINVREVQSGQIFVKELQGNRITAHEIDNTGGSAVLGNVELPPTFIKQIVDKIPWDTLRPPPREQPTPQSQPQPDPQVQQPESQLEAQQEQQSVIPKTPPSRPSRRTRGHVQHDDSDDENLFQLRKTHRRHRRKHDDAVEDEEDRKDAKEGKEKKYKIVKPIEESSSSIPELSFQLVKACTAVGVRTLNNLVQTNTNIVQSLDREMCVQLILCIAITLIAGFFLFGYDAKIVHLHHWDFQFPPQPPHGEF